MTPLRTFLLVALLALFTPAATAAPPAPELPRVYECSQLQVDWYHCDSLVCVGVWYGRVAVYECVPSPCPDLRQCVTCQIGDCLPHVDECSEFQVDWNYCAGYLVCADADHPWADVRPVCVKNPCSPRLACVACDASLCGLVGLPRL